MIKIFETGSSSRVVAGFRVSNHAPQTFFSGRGTSSRKLRFSGNETRQFEPKERMKEDYSKVERKGSKAEDLDFKKLADFSLWRN